MRMGNYESSVRWHNNFILTGISECDPLRKCQRET